MSDLLTNIYSLTAQIASLKNQTGNTNSANSSSNALDPDTAVLSLQQNFNDMLNSLISSSDEDEKEKEASDPFSFVSDYQTSINNLNGQTTQSSSSSLNVNSYTGSIDNLF